MVETKKIYKKSDYNNLKKKPISKSEKAIMFDF
jgi:hypothetical protein